MDSRAQLQQLQELLQIERKADLEQYRQKVLLRSLHQRVKEGTTWYPCRLRKDYIGTGERLIIELDRTSQLDQPHAFQSGKLVNVFSNGAGKPERDSMTGVVNYVRDATMVITLNVDDLPEWIDQSLLGVDLLFDEMSYREMDFALKAVIKAEENRLAELREILLGPGRAGLVSPGVEPVVPDVNASQQNAIQMIHRCADVALVHGPPGTGKTTTLVHAIATVVAIESQVLVCAPSNAAVDLLVEKLSEAGVRVLRIGHPARVTEQSLGKTLDAGITSHPDYRELKRMRKRMEEVRAQASKFRRKFGAWEKEERRLLFEESRKLKSDADLLEFHIVNDLLQKAQAICCTLVGSSHPVLKGRRYRSVFIDEAAQALEAACWIPLMRAERLVLAGDHQQLPPTIKSKDAMEVLSVTLFEKVIRSQPHVSTLLQTQYRMNETIMAFPSSRFYNNQLIADDSVKYRLLSADELPVEFIDTAGAGYTEKQDPETLSRYNEEEAHAMIRLVENLVERTGRQTWLERGLTIGVITPYSAQTDRLRALAESSATLAPLHPLVTINTVDAFQGQERDVIAISFVRSNDKSEVGFLSDIRRTNVAMTRARMKLLMIGDSATLGNHPFYTELIEYTQKVGGYRSIYELM
ncbi:MAG: AAA domain-containing protein [Cyclobacteriaceae bacterium]